MKTKIYVLGLACILLLSCTKKSGSPTGPTDLAPRSYPKISYFTATPSTIKLGEKSALSWEVHNTTKVEIDVGIGVVDSTGSIEVSPSETTTYTLTAWNQEFNDEYQALVTVWETKICSITVEK